MVMEAIKGNVENKKRRQNIFHTYSIYSYVFEYPCGRSHSSILTKDLKKMSVFSAFHDLGLTAIFLIQVYNASTKVKKNVLGSEQEPTFFGVLDVQSITSRIGSRLITINTSGRRARPRPPRRSRRHPPRGPVEPPKSRPSHRAPLSPRCCQPR